ncbi:hypothetical protein AK812_SmicGene40593 [Symbiodinium microadriaticum]|uniref:Uncharacterized protein n=1 Tax=Symbiodinium microadriaticum TaxID=2951 RepID=A0A1Q9C883_SYMMI|nr:hypothetical protein AK812_SmicGene40593 [Symbiodinium microadriaticum]
MGGPDPYMVNGLEWEYGASDTRSSPGVSCTLPGGTADHRFRGTADTMDIVSDLLEDCCFKTLDKVCMPFAGAFHAGVEVHGLELSFGETESRGSLRGTTTLAGDWAPMLSQVGFHCAWLGWQTTSPQRSRPSWAALSPALTQQQQLGRPWSLCPCKKDDEEEDDDEEGC